MTLPEIPKEETNEKPDVKMCPGCGKPCKNLGVHQRYCKASKDKSAMKQEPILNAPMFTTQTPAEPITSPLIISDVQPYIGDDVAWFEGVDNKFFIAPYYIGIVNHVPVVLVQFHDGAIIPPSIIPGFIGMFKEDDVFEGKHDDEPFPPFPEEVDDPVNEVVKPTVLSDTIECKPTEKTKSSWWPFSHNKTSTPKTPITDRAELTGLIEGAINETGRTN